MAHVYVDKTTTVKIPYGNGGESTLVAGKRFDTDDQFVVAYPDLFTDKPKAKKRAATRKADD